MWRVASATSATIMADYNAMAGSLRPRRRRRQDKVPRRFTRDRDICLRPAPVIRRRPTDQTTDGAKHRRSESIARDFGVPSARFATALHTRPMAMNVNNCNIAWARSTKNANRAGAVGRNIRSSAPIARIKLLNQTQQGEPFPLPRESPFAIAAHAVGRLLADLARRGDDLATGRCSRLDFELCGGRALEMIGQPEGLGGV